MTRDELGKLNYNVYRTFAIFKEEVKHITPWEDLPAEEKEPWVVAALQVSMQTLSPEVKHYKVAAKLKIGDVIFGALSWMNGPVPVVGIGLSYDLKGVNVTTQCQFGKVETEFYELDKEVEIQA
jgi:hypothetical protein